MQKSNKNIYFLVIILIYAILSQTVFLKYGLKFTHIINPIFWIFYLIIMFVTMPTKNISKRNESKIIQYTLIATLSYIIIYFLSGLIVTYGKNPYSNTIKGLITNFWVTGIVIIGREFVRYNIINTITKKNKQIITIFTIITFTLLEFNIISLISSITNLSYLFKQIVSSLIPILVKNVVFTTIVQKYTYKSAIIYEIAIKVFFWIAPVLPNSPWILIAILDTTILLILLVFIQTNIETTNNIRLKRRVENTSPQDIIKLGFILVPVVCFSIGIFPIHPKAIATASMYPEIAVGDVVIVKKCEINDITKDDIIEYQIKEQNIIHRVMEIKNEKGDISIITKGDNNNTEDANPIFKEQIVGKVIFKIKYLGLPSIWLNSLINKNKTIYVETGK